MALKDHFRKFLQYLMRDDSNVQRMHDAIEETFTELEADAEQMEDDTFLDDASDAGLARWGTDLDERRLPNQDREQYRARLKQIKQGRMVDDDGIRLALNKWGVPYQLIEFGDNQTFWDLGYYDTVSIEVKARVLVIIFYDPFPVQTQAYWDHGYYDLLEAEYTPTPQEKAAQIAAMNNAVNDARRVKAAGVQVIAYLPASLAS